MTLLAILGLMAALRALVLLVNLVSFPILRPRALHRSPRVSLLIPMRNEAHNLPQSFPGWRAQPAEEILLLDDGSTDGSGELARRLAEGDPRIRVLTGAPLPEGWIGKNWACHQLAQAARGEVLVFTDADTLWAPGALEAVIGELEAQQAGLLSVWPRHQVGTLAERILVPLLEVVLLTLLPYPLVRSRFPLAAAGNGQLMAFRKEAYWASGGHAGVRGAVLEDVELSRRVKWAGYRLGLALGGDFLGVRMYRNYREIVEGFGKNLTAFHGGSRLLLLASSAWYLLAYTLPWLLALAGSLPWALLGLAGLVERLLVNTKTGREPFEALLVPLAPLWAIPIYKRALARRYVWKGRIYLR
jgi:glycosyltransferase involved in cell wall biosynthesis